MKFGYALASAVEPDAEKQLTALKEAGCDVIISDDLPAGAGSRTTLNSIREKIKSGDVIVVCRLDCLADSMRDLISWVTFLDKNNIGLISLGENINTTGIAGEPIFRVFRALADFERNLTRERTKATLSAARACGAKFGRPTALNQEKRDLAVRLYLERRTPVAQICRIIGISKPTLYAYVRAAEAATE